MLSRSLLPEQFSYLTQLLQKCVFQYQLFTNMLFLRDFFLGRTTSRLKAAPTIGNSGLYIVLTGFRIYNISNLRVIGDIGALWHIG